MRDAGERREILKGMDAAANYYGEIARLYIAAGYAEAALIASARSGQPVPPETSAAIDKAAQAVKTLGLKLRVDEVRSAFERRP